MVEIVWGSGVGGVGGGGGGDQCGLWASLKLLIFPRPMGVGVLEVAGGLWQGWGVVSSPGLLIALSESQPLSGLHCLHLCYRETR